MCAWCDPFDLEGHRAGHRARPPASEQRVGGHLPAVPARCWTSTMQARPCDRPESAVGCGACMKLSCPAIEDGMAGCMDHRPDTVQRLRPVRAGYAPLEAIEERQGGKRMKDGFEYAHRRRWRTGYTAGQQASWAALALANTGQDVKVSEVHGMSQRGGSVDHAMCAWATACIRPWWRWVERIT